MKKRMLLVSLLIVGSFTGGFAISKYRQPLPAVITIHYNMTEYNEDGTIYDTAQIVRFCNGLGEWSETQVFANGKLFTSHGNATPRDEGLASFPRKEILDRTVVVLSDKRSDAWYDPSLHQFLKFILYTDETRKTVQMVEEAVEIKD